MPSPARGWSVPGDLRRKLLEVSRQLLAAGEGQAPTTFSVTISSDGQSLTFRPRPREFGGEAAALPELHRLILSRLTAEPQTVKALARACGRSYSGRFREAVADLVRDRKAHRGPEGISREVDARE